MSIKITSGALSLILCIAAALILVYLLFLGVYLVTQAPQFKDLVGAQILELPEPPKPEVRKPDINQTDQTDNPKSQ